MRKRIFALVLAIALVLSLGVGLVACNNKKTPIRISTTTSVNDSGLMDYLTPYFEADNPDYKLEISSAGTGAAINAAKYGNADLILVHSKTQEDAFVAEKFARKVEGFDAERISFMYNYFVVIGPSADPAGVGNAESVEEAFANIASGKHNFVSRGDNSGTHSAEIKLWDEALGITKDVENLPEEIEDWYVSAGSGMGACLTMANEQNAYVLSDKATYLKYKNDKDGDKLPQVKLLKEESASLKNTYSMIAIDKDAPFVDASGEALASGSVSINETAADVFIKWMASERASKLIKIYGESDYGAPLFYIL